jgi:alkylresorcinol/alkylpyrone synthase
VGAETYTFPSSLDAMGFSLQDSGFHIVLSKEVPYMIRERIRALVDEFLGRRHLALNQIAAFVLHPGGQKVLSFMEQELGLHHSDTDFSRDVLRRFGNLSSATILFILHEWLTRKRLNRGAYGLLAAFGPGFSAELMLLQWPE